MKKIGLFVATIIALCSSSAVSASEAHEYGRTGHWYISDDEDGTCSMTGSYDRDTIFFIEYNDRIERSTFSFSDPAYKSLKKGDKRELRLVFVTPSGTLDDGWGNTDYFVGKLDDGTPILTATYKGREMLVDLMKNKSIGLFYNDDVVESLNLAGITPAVRMLEACAKAEARSHPMDIFAK
jgi:hypothetical protein